MTSKERFEAFCLDYEAQGNPELNLAMKQDEDGADEDEYEDFEVQLAYDAWQACEAQSAARIAQLAKELNKETLEKQGCMITIAQRDYRIAQLEGENVRIRNAAREAINTLRKALATADKIAKE